MAKEKKSYVFYGELVTNIPISLNGVSVKAYSEKQARLLLSFKLKKDNNSITIPVKELFYIVKKSKLTIRVE